MIDTNNRRFQLFGLAGCVALIAAAPLHAEPAVSAPVCLYANKSYSEGAFVCVQKSLMLSCVTDGGRAR
jgi:hypothetical protein